jgi:hypothetical protein
MFRDHLLLVRLRHPGPPATYDDGWMLCAAVRILPHVVPTEAEDTQEQEVSMDGQIPETGCVAPDRSGTWRSLRVVTVMGAILVSSSACDHPVAVERQSTGQVEFTQQGTNGGTRFSPNSRRYREQGAAPVAARAGQGTLSAVVLKDGRGRTDVQLAAGSLDGSPTVLGMVQLKGYAPDGRLLFTRNDAPGPRQPTAAYALGGIPRGGRVQVQANVDHGDRSRSGVVTLEAPVLLRPDLQVASIAAPARAARRTMVGISATIREANGDFGASANCALLVDGVEVDRAWGIWVDAGSAVSCAFRHLFERLGPAEVMVRLVDIAPRDYDPDNDSARMTVEVISIPSAFQFDASFRDETWESFSRYESLWQTANGRQGYAGSDESQSSGREQHGMLWGWMPRQVTFPLDELVVQQLTRDETVHFARFTGVAPDIVWQDDYLTQSCVMRWFHTANGYMNFELCNLKFTGERDGATYLYYSRNAGEVTYHSRGDARWWDQDAGMEDVWSWNYSDSSQSGRMVSYGREYGFFIGIADANGTHRMQPLIWLEPFSDSYQSPWTCWEYSDDWGSSQSCSESRRSGSGMRGWTVGLPTY